MSTCHQITANIFFWINGNVILTTMWGWLWSRRQINTRSEWYRLELKHPSSLDCFPLGFGFHFTGMQASTWWNMNISSSLAPLILPHSLPPLLLPPSSPLIMLLKWCVAGESAALVPYITVKVSWKNTAHQSTVRLTVGGQCSPQNCGGSSSHSSYSV